MQLYVDGFPRSAKGRVCLFVATAGGLGLSPFAPGTCGALLGVLMHGLIVLWLPPSATLAALAVSLWAVCAASYLLTPWAQYYWQDPDPGHFVLDEVAGYLIVPLLFHHGAFWQQALWGFVLFRAYDMIKLPVARQIDERMHGAMGIILDDMVSGIYAVMTMFGIMWLGTRLGWQAWLIIP